MPFDVVGQQMDEIAELKQRISELERQLADAEEQDLYSKLMFQLMERDNAKLREALERISSYGQIAPNYSGEIIEIARQALERKK